MILGWAYVHVSSIDGGCYICFFYYFGWISMFLESVFEEVDSRFVSFLCRVCSHKPNTFTFDDGFEYLWRVIGGKVQILVQI